MVDIGNIVHLRPSFDLPLFAKVADHVGKIAVLWLRADVNPVLRCWLRCVVVGIRGRRHHGALADRIEGDQELVLVARFRWRRRKVRAVPAAETMFYNDQGIVLSGR